MANGTLQVFIVLPPDAVPYGPGEWSVTGFPNQTSGTTVSLVPGEYIITFSGVEFATTPRPITVTIVSDQLTIQSGSYCQLEPETILESACKGLEETPCKALNTVLTTPLFFAASAVDASFSGWPGTAAITTEGPPGKAYTAAKLLGAVFNEGYQIMLEGGQTYSDLISEFELEAIATLVAPYLTPSGSALPGGVPIWIGYLLIHRHVTSWVIQRGKGFSLQPAIDAGYITGVPGYIVNPSWESIASMPGPEITVTGFAAAFNGTQPPTGFEGAPINGMPTALPMGLMVSGYPASGGGNISQPTNIAGSVSIHTVNDDDSINACMDWSEFALFQVFLSGDAIGETWEYFQTLFSAVGGTPYGNGIPNELVFTFCAFPQVTTPPGPPYLIGGWFPNLPGFTPPAQYPVLFAGPLAATRTAANSDYYNILATGVLGGVPGSSIAAAWWQGMPPAYYDGSPDWTWQYDPTIPPEQNGPVWTLTWNGTNAQVNTRPVVIIFWLGLTPNQVPQTFYFINSDEPVHQYTPPPPSVFPKPALEIANAQNRGAPVDRNAPITITTNNTVSPFTIQLGVPETASLYNIFNLQ